MKTITEMVEVMLAYANGKQIECKSFLQKEWHSVEKPFWNWLDNDYRVKKEW